MRDIRILAVPGSLRRESANAALLRAAAGLTEPGVVVEPWGGLGVVPPFDEDAEGDVPAAVADLRDAIAAADALLVATPEYNGSIPGQLKNALDWASRPHGDGVLSGTPVGVVSASPSGWGGVQAADHLVGVLDASGAAVLGRRFALPRADAAFTADGCLADPAHEDALRRLVAELGAAAAAEVARPAA